MKIDDLDINYIQYGKGKDIVLLHGWAQNIEMMKYLGDELSGFRITILDLPGFGASSMPTSVLTIYDYRDVLDKFLNKLKITNPIIIGHSFGGRIAITYAATKNIEKLILFGSPCFRKRGLTLKERTLKTVKKMVPEKFADLAKKYIGSADYKKADPRLRKILVEVVNADLTEDARNIKCPTLLIWGTNDDAAPIAEARELESILSDGALIELEGYGHYAYIEAKDQVKNILDSFLGGNN